MKNKCQKWYITCTLAYNLAESSNVIKILTKVYKMPFLHMTPKDIAKIFIQNLFAENQSDINILQGNVATLFRCGGTFDSLALLQIYF